MEVRILPAVLQAQLPLANHLSLERAASEVISLASTRCCLSLAAGRVGGNLYAMIVAVLIMRSRWLVAAKRTLPKKQDTLSDDGSLQQQGTLG